jgi:8-amino-7-oxononanoate synthase
VRWALGAFVSRMGANPSLVEAVARRARLAGFAILDRGNPWFIALDELRAEIEAGGGTLTSFANYDYLGIAGHPAVHQAANEALARFGTGVLGSRLVGGERTIHSDLEHALARFMGAEAALTLVSGYLTNTTIIPHLVGSRDLLIMDELCHNSILAGARGARAEVVTFRHNDLDHLQSILKTKRTQARACMIVVEGLYSMDGDIPDLPRLLNLKDAYDAWLFIDEAHSLGVLGATGRGISEHFGEDPSRIDLIIGTLSKALASCGGFVCARKEVIEYLKFTLAGFVYSVGLSPVITAAAHAGLDLIASEPGRVAAARRAAEQFLDKTRQSGLQTGTAIGRGIVPIMFADLDQTMRASQALLRANIYAPPIVHVGVPKDQPRIRFFLSAKHDGHPAIDTAVAVLAREAGAARRRYDALAAAMTAAE